MGERKEIGGVVITVLVKINEHIIIARSASRVKGEPGEMCTYQVDDGRVIRHHYDHGAARLAQKLLEGVTDLE
jgi:hypothetical protein